MWFNRRGVVREATRADSLNSEARHCGNATSKSTYALDAQFQNKIEAAVTFEHILVEKRGYVAEHYGKWYMLEIFNWSANGATRAIGKAEHLFTAPGAIGSETGVQ